MGILSVIVAAVAAWVFGAVWYMLLATPWQRVSGANMNREGKPLGGALPFILSFIAMIVVAGFMRHIFAMSGIDTVGKGLLSGLGVGLFFVSPWIVINNAYPDRPFLLSAIDSGYAVGGCTIMGVVLMLFA
ncbi:DUF1761 domain-containing protein [Maritimibacter sp. DP1N21-5]|uniref:DUF1761 domain-containing protein n=1 Tax=Maritimibacter sp. DP1N21-5 TaxID=2836867 RepID=UPI001C437FDF|nr:DUF1761 domain-containing protein [Maritimibacter sp. DP1N21-5]MBV7410964.1 DUF1761 domain-containing protein [Maritimibacter sp. DP1N21-5]